MSLSFLPPPTAIENLHSSPQAPYLNTTPSLSAEELDSCFHRLYRDCWASLVTQMVKNLPAMQETWVRSLGWEDALEKEMATHSSILAWRILWTEEPGGPRPMDSQLYVTKQLTHTHTHTHIMQYTLTIVLVFTK